MESKIAQQQNNSAKYAFLYLLSLVSLVFMSTSVGIVIFQIINKVVKDPVKADFFNSDALKFAISALIIAAPIYFLTTRQINKSLYSGAMDKESGVRKWLTYFILLITSVVMIGWLIGTINSFLSGDITVKFILKALASIVIAGSIFGYYFYDIKREQIIGSKDKTIASYSYISMVVVLVALVAALFFIESPTQARNRLRDNQLINKFDQIDSAINSYYAENKKLPQSLDVLVREKRVIDENEIKDPVSGEKIGYKPGNEKIYELCGNFLSSNKEDPNPYYKSRWQHDIGNQCISQRVYDSAQLKGEKPIPAPIE